jgi:hypothetical protein
MPPSGPLNREGARKPCDVPSARNDQSATSPFFSRELGAALKAFPDSIQVHETGTIWNPTPGEVQNSRDLGGHSRSAYSSLAAPRSAEAAEHNRYQPGQDHDNGQDQGISM